MICSFSLTLEESKDEKTRLLRSLARLKRLQPLIRSLPHHNRWAIPLFGELCNRIADSGAKPPILSKDWFPRVLKLHQTVIYGAVPERVWVPIYRETHIFLPGLVVKHGNKRHMLLDEELMRDWARMITNN